MAIDTAAKRFSILTIEDLTQPPITIPSGTIAQAERQALLNGYYGILWDDSDVIIRECFLTSGRISRELLTNGKIFMGLDTNGRISRELLTTGVLE